MPKKAEKAIRNRRGTHTQAEAARRAAAEARGKKAAPKPKAAPKKAAPKPKAQPKRSPTPAQTVPSISGGSGTRSRRLDEIEKEIRRLQQGRK